MAKQFGCFIKEARTHIDEWDAETAHERVQTGGVLVVDVREADECATGRIAGAIHVPRGIIEAAADPGTHYRHPLLCEACRQPVLLYCQSGGRSALAAWVLQQMGFEDVHSLAGGLECWKAEGYGLE